MFRVYSNNFYDEVTPNTIVNNIKEYNKIDRDTLEESGYRRIDLDKSENWNNSVEFTRNTFVTDYQFKNEDEVQLYLVNKAGKIYILKYKNKDSISQGKVFNITLPVGQYALFVKVNDNLYRTNKVYQF